MYLVCKGASYVPGSVVGSSRQRRDNGRGSGVFGTAMAGDGGAGPPAPISAGVAAVLTRLCRAAVAAA